MDFQGENILSTKQFNKESLLEFFGKVKRLEERFEEGECGKMLCGKILATLFYEPSTRTRFSFEAAMNRLGGRVLANADMMATSSAKKRETLEDTGKVVSQMVDVIAMRHPEAGSVAKLASKSDCPVINAGDGASEHPTQALLDLYTIWKEKDGIDGLTVGLIGDLKNGRVPHSQCDLLKHFDVKFVFVSPEGLRMPGVIVKELKDGGSSVLIEDEIDDAISYLDVIGVTRIQEERFESREEYEKYAGVYVLSDKLMKMAKKDAIVLHPLPRVDEIEASVDDDPRAKYFEQVGNGVAVRMGLLCEVLGVEV